MPSWKKIIGFGTLIIVLLASCALGANFIINFHEPSDVLTTGVILFFVVIPALGVLWKLLPGILELIAAYVRGRNF